LGRFAIVTDVGRGLQKSNTVIPDGAPAPIRNPEPFGRHKLYREIPGSMLRIGPE
jgi:hypothetical protein